MIRIIIVDDDPLEAIVLESYSSKIADIVLVGSFTDPLLALSFLNENRIDLAFLDVNMPVLTGLEMVQQLTSPPKIILTTAFPQYAIDAYSLKVIDYLLKPITFERFSRSIKRYKELFSGESIKSLPSLDNHVFIKSGQCQVRLKISEISHIQSDGNYLHLYTAHKRTTTRMTFNQLIGFIETDLFIRIHHSFMVNLNHIEKIENNHVYCNGTAIPIGTKYREEFLQRLGID